MKVDPNDIHVFLKKNIYFHIILFIFLTEMLSRAVSCFFNVFTRFRVLTC